MIHKYKATDKMSDLIEEVYSLLTVLSRFNISLVCRQNQVDTNTFLTIVNFLSEDDYSLEHSYEKIDLPSLISYLKNAHKYFLEFKLPLIREKLILAIKS